MGKTTRSDILERIRRVTSFEELIDGLDYEKTCTPGKVQLIHVICSTIGRGTLKRNVEIVGHNQGDVSCSLRTEQEETAEHVVLFSESVRIEQEALLLLQIACETTHIVRSILRLATGLELDDVTV